ncbi:translation initiation factor IF-2 [Patescibacteria group bacterium]|nr:translation initiation factor IF-2 [Patescibacteria group bacterium]
MAKKKEQKKKLQTRPPVVVILGHVDHGKTSILDYIRKSKVAEKESGGITQHIGAYQVEHQDKLITFIDTPGHEAFSAMRSRGAKIADIAILVVAAEEGIKPQTKEAIQHIKKTGIPAIVAINKIDKKEAQPEKVKGELAKQDILVESFNGSVPSINVSAKTGQGIDNLLEMINLVSEMEELKDDPNQPTSGAIVESNCNSQRGNTATLLVREGILTNKDIIGTDSAFGKVKIMEDFQGKPIKEATASTPAVVTGFNQVPQVGEKFYIFDNLNEAQARVNRKSAKRQPEDNKEVLVFEANKKILNIILKCDVYGCLEAIKESLRSIPSKEVAIRILKADAGEINESDIKLAESAKAKIISFRNKTSSAIQRLANQKKVKIITFDIIYELIQAVRELLSKLLEPEITRNVIGQLKVLAVFRTEKDKQIIGGKVTNGQAKQGIQTDIIRGTTKIGKGRIAQLQRDKKEIDEVNKGQECGIQFRGDTIIEEGDILEFYQEERKKKEI